MPDQADVEQALAVFVSGVLYPNGTAAASVLGTVCRVYRGFPVVGTLEGDLVEGIAHVAVQPVSGSSKITTRYGSEWVGAAPACPLLVDTEGVAVQFSGAAAAGVVAGVLVDGQAYAWRAGDVTAPEVVAAVLAEMVQADRVAELSGATITFPAARQVVARAVSDGVGGEELRRQEMRFRVSLWCPSPDVRDQMAAVIDLALAGVVFLDVGGWGCRLISAGGSTADEGAAARAWRRELEYLIEYPTVIESSLPSLLFGSGTVNGAAYFG